MLGHRFLLALTVWLLIGACAAAQPEGRLQAATSELSLVRSTSESEAAVAVQLVVRNRSRHALCFPIHAIVGPLFDKSLLEVVGPNGRMSVPDGYRVLMRETSLNGVLVIFPGQTYSSSTTINDIYPFAMAGHYTARLVLPVFACDAMDRIRSLSDHVSGWRLGQLSSQASIVLERPAIAPTAN